MDLIDLIRTIAKSSDYQNIYILSKEINSIKLVNNDNNFTYIQNLFFKYLNFYYNLYSDINIGEIDESVLSNFIYEDSYMMWKNKTEKERYKNPSKNQEKVEEVISPTTKWIFKDSKIK